MARQNQGQNHKFTARFMKNDNTELVSNSLLHGYSLRKQEENWGDCSEHPLPPCWCPDTDRLSGALPRDRLSARWTRSEPGRWVTVPEARACLQPRSCRWRCTGRWQTGRRWPPRSGSAGSGAFWLQEGKEGQMWKVEVSTHLCLFKSVCNVGPFPFVYFWRKECLCF